MPAFEVMVATNKRTKAVIVCCAVLAKISLGLSATLILAVKSRPITVRDQGAD